jgi:uncharacterized protein (TIGR03435 family)
VVGKGGSKFQPGTEIAPLPADAAERAKVLEQRRNENLARIKAHCEYFSGCRQAYCRSNWTLTGFFSFNLWFAHPQPGWQGELPAGEMIFDVVKRDLGLDLQHRKEELEMLVVDRANRAPIRN